MISGLTGEAIGVVVGLLATCVQSAGLALQRQSHMLENSKNQHFIRLPPYKRLRWQIGITMFVLANIFGGAVQLTTLPLPVLSTLQASCLVFNSACAYFLLNERFSFYSFIGTILIVMGAALIAFYGSIVEPSHDVDQLLVLMRGNYFQIWMGCTLLMIAVILSICHLQPQIWSHRTTALDFLKGNLCGVVSGVLSAHTLLLAKFSIELLVCTFSGKSNQLIYWQTWVIFILLVTTALIQLYYLNRGLRLVSTSVLYPLSFCVYNIFAIFDSLIFYQQIASFSAVDAVLTSLGTVILLIGVFVLSWRLEMRKPLKLAVADPPKTFSMSPKSTPSSIASPITDVSVERSDLTPVSKIDSQMPQNSGQRTRKLNSAFHDKICAALHKHENGFDSDLTSEHKHLVAETTPLMNDHQESWPTI